VTTSVIICQLKTKFDVCTEFCTSWDWYQLHFSYHSARASAICI